jgi:Forkhead domain
MMEEDSSDDCDSQTSPKSKQSKPVASAPVREKTTDGGISYATVIAEAILSSPCQGATLNGIYTFFERKFNYFNNGHWKVLVTESRTT